MSIVIVITLILIGSHYLTYILGEEASDIKWRKWVRELEARRMVEEDMKKQATAVARSVPVKSATTKARKVAIKKK